MSNISIISWLLPAFIFFTTSLCAKPIELNTHSPLDKGLYNNPVWHQLLHLEDNQAQIDSDKFLLSSDSFSPKAELMETLKLFQRSPKNALCRYPARYLFLFSQQGTPIGDNDFSHCVELDKFINFVPFDKLSLVFASEVVDSASSMMGHVFLKATGKNLNNNQVSHSISFFTEINTLNPASLIYDGLIGGMDGFFIVRQYQQDKARYLNEEGRNLWHYQLDLSNFEKQLIKLHIWELKDINITYLFQSYNCADLTLELLALAKPEVRSDTFIVTPIDVVKKATQNSMITNKQVLLSPEWEGRMYLSQLELHQEQAIHTFLMQPELADLSVFKSKNEIKTAQQYLQFLQSINKVNSKQIKEFNKKANVKQLTDAQVDIANYKSPLKTPNDSIVGMDWVNHSKKQFLDLRFVPTSHYLRGDNSQYHSESELIMGELVMRASLNSENISLNKLTLYSMLSLVPDTKHDSKWSKQVYSGFKKEKTLSNKEIGVFETALGIGKTVELHRDVLTYGILNFGIGYGDEKLYGTLSPKIGAIVNLIGNSKLTLNHQFTRGRLNEFNWQQRTNATLTWLGANNLNISLKVEYLELFPDNEVTTTLSIDLLF